MVCPSAAGDPIGFNIIDIYFGARPYPTSAVSRRGRVGILAVGEGMIIFNRGGPIDDSFAMSVSSLDTLG